MIWRTLVILLAQSNTYISFKSMYTLCITFKNTNQSMKIYLGKYVLSRQFQKPQVKPNEAFNNK